MDERKTIRVLFLAAEASPFVKVGGLGDIAGSLPQAIRSLPPSQFSSDDTINADIRLLLPLHGKISEKGYSLKLVTNLRIPYKGGTSNAAIYETENNGLPVYLLSGDFIHPDSQVYSPDIYADVRKYTFFSQAVLEFISNSKWKPHILHANDWHTSAAVYGLKIRSKTDETFSDIFSVMGIHNLAYMGKGSEQFLHEFGLPLSGHSDLPEWATDIPLALGIAYADRIVTVSPTYACEIQTPEFGENLHEYLSSRKDSIFGILNGIDYAEWDPQKDPFLSFRFGVENIESRIRNKNELQKELGFSVNPEIPLIGMVTRIVFQKGFDLIPEAMQIFDSFNQDNHSWQMVILGKGEQVLEDMALQLEDQFPEKVKAVIRYDEKLSRRIYAGADMLLIPSRYEPCGLTQMIGMRYGCIPLARETGGLKDTIKDNGKDAAGTGFLFSGPTSLELALTLQRAIDSYHDKKVWQSIQKRAMKSDFSWNQSARDYLELYWDLLNKQGSSKWN